MGKEFIDPHDFFDKNTEKSASAEIDMLTPDRAADLNIACFTASRNSSFLHTLLLKETAAKHPDWVMPDYVKDEAAALAVQKHTKNFFNQSGIAFDLTEASSSSKVSGEFADRMKELQDAVNGARKSPGDYLPDIADLLIKEDYRSIANDPGVLNSTALLDESYICLAITMSSEADAGVDPKKITKLPVDDPDLNDIFRDTGRFLRQGGFNRLTREADDLFGAVWEAYDRAHPQNPTKWKLDG